MTVIMRTLTDLFRPRGSSWPSHRRAQGRSREASSSTAGTWLIQNEQWYLSRERTRDAVVATAVDRGGGSPSVTGQRSDSAKAMTIQAVTVEVWPDMLDLHNAATGR
jgi:hypothetical protein